MTVTHSVGVQLSLIKSLSSAYLTSCLCMHGMCLSAWVSLDLLNQLSFSYLKTAESVPHINYVSRGLSNPLLTCNPVTSLLLTFSVQQARISFFKLNSDHVTVLIMPRSFLGILGWSHKRPCHSGHPSGTCLLLSQLRTLTPNTPPPSLLPILQVSAQVPTSMLSQFPTPTDLSPFIIKVCMII